MIVGEAPGETEQQLGIPFVGFSGQELFRMLDQAEIKTHECFFTNVFHCRPPGNDLTAFCTRNAKDAISGLPAVKPGYFIHKEFSKELARLGEEVRDVRPNLIIALGNTALGAFTGFSGITKVRGTLVRSRSGHKVLPTFHPSSVLRQWNQRVIVVTDFIKAKHESEFPEILIPAREILINPTVFQVEDFVELTLPRYTHVSIDIETKGSFITHIGFAVSPHVAISIPFTDTSPEHCYWKSDGEWRRVLTAVRKVLAGSWIKIFQNGAYDVQRLWRDWGFPVFNFREDTMLQAHALYPEMQKSLGFLGSLYTAEPAWKLLRHRTKDEQGKREE